MYSYTDKLVKPRSSMLYDATKLHHVLLHRQVGLGAACCMMPPGYTIYSYTDKLVRPGSSVLYDATRYHTLLHRQVDQASKMDMFQRTV